MDKAVFVGMVAALCTTAAFLPQVIKVYRTKQTKDLSLTMYAIFMTGVVLWVYFGMLTNMWPIILANAVIFVLCGYILVMKVIHK